MYIPLILLVTFALKGVQTDKDIMPVFLLDLGGVMDHLYVEPNPFTKISTAFFASIIHDAIKRSEVVIVFVEDHFSVEDISLKDNQGTPYINLHEGLVQNKVKYLPKVIGPYKLLNQIFQPQQFNVFYMGSGTKMQMFDGHFKHFFIFFRDWKNETRAEALRGHDLIMREVYFVVRQLSKGPVVAFYTGKMNPVQVEKIEFVPIAPIEAQKHPGVLVVTDGALFRFVGVFAVTQFRRAMFNQVPIVAEETWTADTLSTKMAYTDFELEFNFSFEDREWMLDTVALLEGGEEVGRTVMAVGARWNWAYYCGEPLVLVNHRDGSFITISEYKGLIDNSTVKDTFAEETASLNIERLEDEGEGEGAGEGEGGGGGGGEEGGEGGGEGSATFGKTVNCGPYYSVGILACLFVVFICLGMLAVGLVAIYSVHTNDKYEDQHGKVLVMGFER